MILVVSHEDDAHAAEVLGALRRLRAPARLLDLASFPRTASVDLRYGGGEPRLVLTPRGAPPLRLDRVKTIWWRRPQPPVLHDAVEDEARRAFAWRECREALMGMLGAARVRWVNHPERHEAAGRKALQLSVAHRVGLAVPRTCITSDPARARAFVAARERTVFKALQATPADWRETRLVGAAERRRLGNVRYAPVVFQAYVPGVDVRATVVGGRTFAAEIDARDTSYPHDFRPVFDEARVAPVELPRAVAAGLRRYCRALGLSFAAVDLRRDARERHWFLEANPAGQWLFVERRTGQPITRAVAALLAGGGRAS